MMTSLQKLFHVTAMVTVVALGAAGCGSDSTGGAGTGGAGAGGAGAGGAGRGGAGGAGGSAGMGGSGGSMGTKPNAPSMLTATPLSGGAHLTWKDNSSDEEMFMIMRKEGSGSFATSATVPFNTTQYHDATTMSGKTYTYMVHAMKGDALSDPSNEAMVTIP